MYGIFSRPGNLLERVWRRLIGRLLATCEASEILLVKFDSRSKLYAFLEKIDKWTQPRDTE
jgi:hypothetical protein